MATKPSVWITVITAAKRRIRRNRQHTAHNAAIPTAWAARAPPTLIFPASNANRQSVNPNGTPTATKERPSRHRRTKIANPIGNAASKST